MIRCHVAQKSTIPGSLSPRRVTFKLGREKLAIEGSEPIPCSFRKRTIPKKMLGNFKFTTQQTLRLRKTY